MPSNQPDTAARRPERGRAVLLFGALLATALTAGLEFAHVLEWAPKSTYSGRLYVQLQESLYVWFGTVGAAIYLLAVAATVALAIALRAEPVARASLRVAAGLEVVALASFLAVIYPVNLRLPLHDGRVPGDWSQLRLRWELGHTIGFVLFGLALVLLLGLVVGTSKLTRKQATARSDDPAHSDDRSRLV